MVLPHGKLKAWFQSHCLSLDADSAATLVHAFVTSRADYLNAILDRRGSEDNNRQATTTALNQDLDWGLWLQRVLNAAARVVSDSRKFDQGLSRLIHQELHWLDIPEWVKLQAGSADPPVSARQGASVPMKPLHSSQSSSYTAASTLRCTSSPDSTSTSSQHIRSAGVCCRWSDNV